MKYGYINAPNKKKNYNKQNIAIRRHMVDEVIIEDVHFNYPNSKLKKFVEEAKKGDKLIVQTMSAIGLPFNQLLSFLKELQAKGIDIRILDVNIDTEKAKYQSFYEYVDYFMEMNRQLVSDRQYVNHEKKFYKTRSPKVTPEDHEEIHRLRKEGKTLMEITELMDLSYATIHKYAKMDIKN